MYGVLACEVRVHLVSQEACDRSHELGNSYEHFESRLVYGLLVVRHLTAPESAARSSDVPVGEVFCYEVLDSSYSLHVIVVIHLVCDCFDQTVVLAEDPSVELRSLLIRYVQGSAVYVVLVAVEYEEVIYVLQSTEEFAYCVFEAVLVELRRSPCRRYGYEIPLRSVCAVLLEEFERADSVASRLRHLLAVLVEDEIVDEYVLVGSLALHERRYGHKRIEPSSCLVDTFADEVSRESVCIEVGFVLERPVPLGERSAARVEPAVHYLRYTRHHLAALRTCEVDVVHIRSVQFDRLVDVFDSLFHEFLSASYALKMTAFASPDRDRCSPVSVSGDSPVFDVSKPVAESLVADIGRPPVDCIVVRYELVLELAHADVPAAVSIVNERSLASPAVRIVMSYSFFVIYLLFTEVFHDLYRETVFHDEVSLPRTLCELSFKVYRLEEYDVVLLACDIVVFTECRRRVNEACTVCVYYEVAADDFEFVSFRNIGFGEYRLVFLIFEILTFFCSDYFVVSCSEHSVCSSFSYAEDASFVRTVQHLRPYVCELGVYHDRNVGVKRPCRCRPCEEVFVLCALLPEFTCKRQDIVFLVAESYFVGSKTCSASRAPRNYFVSFEQESSVECALQNMPSCFDVVVVECDVGVFKIDRHTKTEAEVFPVAYILEYGFLTFLVELFDTVVLDLELVVEAEFLLDFELYRKTVCVPAGSRPALVTFHDLVLDHGILKSSCHRVMYARTAVSRRRTFYPYEGFVSFAGVIALFQEVVLLPFCRPF